MAADEDIASLLGGRMQRGWGVAGFACFAAAVFGGAGAAGAASEPCALARALVAAHRVQDALVAYEGAAATCPNRAHDLEQLRQAAGDRDLALARATHDIAAKHPGAARLDYLKALSADAGSNTAATGLANLDKVETPDPFAGARALLHAGYRADAKSKLLKDLGGGASLSSTKSDAELRSLADPPHLWDGIRERGRHILDNLLSYGIGVLVGAAIVNLLVLEWIRRRRSTPPAVPQTSPMRRLRRAWRRLTQPRLSVIAGEGANGKLFAAQVRVAVRTSDVSHGTASVALASYPEDSLDLSALEDIDSRLKPVVAALKLLARHDAVTARCSLATEDSSKLRALVEASAAGRPAQSVSLSRPSSSDKTDAVPTACPTPSVVGLSAGWLLFAAEDLRPRIREGKRRVELYGTDDRRSFSAYLGGVESYLSGDLPTARELFSEAVGHDAENLRAQLNLAVTELQDTNPAVWASGIDRLVWLLVRAA